jgi:hypothetical protein
MKPFLSLLCLSILTVSAAVAADPPPARVAAKKPVEESKSAPADKAKAEETVPIMLKTKSSFNIDAGMRSPFWPISWKPTGKVATGGTDQGEVPAGAFVVSTITLDGATKFAIINGKSMSEGQQFGLQVGTQIYQVTVKRIEDGRVVLGRRDEEIVVPLRRK